MRTERNRLAEAFIRGIQIGSEQPDLAGDGDAMYQEFREWIFQRTECRSCLGLGFKGGIVDATGGPCEHCHGSGWEPYCPACGGKGFEWVDGPYGYTTSAASGVQQQICVECSIDEDRRDFESRMP